MDILFRVAIICSLSRRQEEQIIDTRIASIMLNSSILLSLWTQELSMASPWPAHCDYIRSRLVSLLVVRRDMTKVEILHCPACQPLT